MTQHPLDAALAELAPSGTLRAGIVVAPVASAFFAAEKNGAVAGVTVDLFRALAQQSGLPLDLRYYPNSGEVTAAVADGACDVAFMPRDATREAVVAFGPSYILIESTFLVPAGSPFREVAETNHPGVRAVAIAGTTTSRSARRFLTAGAVEDVRTVDELIERARTGAADLFALSRDAFIPLLSVLPGARILSGNFQAMGVGIAVARGRPRALAHVSAFIEATKVDGAVRRALDRAGYGDLPVAPAGR
jgi:polar amino acid transport system substrate-binding protein